MRIGIIGIGGVIRAIQKNSSMWWIIALALGILVCLIIIVYKVAFPKFKSIQGLIDRLNLVSRENLSGMMVIRAFNREKWEEGRFDEANRDLTATMLFVNRLMVVLMPFMMLVMNGVTLLIIWMMIELMDNEIKTLKGGKFNILVFIGVIIVALIREILISTLRHDALDTQAFLAGTLLILGVVYYLVARSQQNGSP